MIRDVEKAVAALGRGGVLECEWGGGIVGGWGALVEWEREGWGRGGERENNRGSLKAVPEALPSADTS